MTDDTKSTCQASSFGIEASYTEGFEHMSSPHDRAEPQPFIQMTGCQIDVRLQTRTEQGVKLVDGLLLLHCKRVIARFY